MPDSANNRLNISPQQQICTLSDLLASDVRDYFRREGVSDHISSEQPIKPLRRSRNTKQPLYPCPPSTSPLRPFSAGWNAPISPAKFSSLKQQKFQKSCYQGLHNHDAENSNNFIDNTSHWTHRRRSSGSGSLHSRSSYSRGKVVSLADAEFLKNYAQEKKRANLQAFNKSLVKRSAYLDVIDGIVDCDSSIIGNEFMPVSQFHSPKDVKRQTGPLAARSIDSHKSSQRPPTVVGSHRPGLASIDNDDWEKNDLIDRKYKKKMDQKEARILFTEGSSLSGDGLGSVVNVVTPGSREMTHQRQLLNVCPLEQANFLNSSGSFRKHDVTVPVDHNFRHYRTLSSLSSLENPVNSIALKENVDSIDSCTREKSVSKHQFLERLNSGVKIVASSKDYGSVSHQQLWGKENKHPIQSGQSLSYTSVSSDSFQSATNSHRFKRPSLQGSNIHFYQLCDGNGIDPLSERPELQQEHYNLNDNTYQRQLRQDSSDESDTICSSSSNSGDNVHCFASSNDSHALFSVRNNISDIPALRCINESNSFHIEKTSNEQEHFGHKMINYSSTKNCENKSDIMKKQKVAPLRLDDAMEAIRKKVSSTFLTCELYISNMPSMVGSLALAWSSLGVDWFTWYEETSNSCHHADYHDILCVNHEFPGCFICDTTGVGYKLFLQFHRLCSVLSSILVSCLIFKIIVAFPVVRDELANPTTAAPLGLLCMALEKNFGGTSGYVGMILTYLASSLQTFVSIWFIFISIVYKTLPEPSWFPNTTGLGLAAVKIYLYWTLGGYTLSALSILLFLMFYFVALHRIHTNEKISAPVCWVQLSGPSVVLYGFSIFGQPGDEKDELALRNEETEQHYLNIHRTYFMPIMHFFFACCVVSMVSALYCLATRLKWFRAQEFSPAHLGFCAPLLSYANALQVYLSAVKKYSTLPYDSLFRVFLYHYWSLCLLSGTILMLALSWRFVKCLPIWCQLYVEDDEIPPDPNETIITRLLEKGEVKDAMTQNYVSAAILQANESGALVRVIRDGQMMYVRSRRTLSMGFDPIMTQAQLTSERDRLLQNVNFAASLSDRRRLGSFNDTLSSGLNSDNSVDSSESCTPTSRRNRLNFISFDASSLMRGLYP